MDFLDIENQTALMVRKFYNDQLCKACLFRVMNRINYREDKSEMGMALALLEPLILGLKVQIKKNRISC